MKNSVSKVLGLLGSVVLCIVSAFFLAKNIVPEENFTLTNLTGFFLGLIQGLTEFIPISSSAHLTICPMLLSWGDPGEGLIAVLQLGSIIAVFYYFKKDILDLFCGSWEAINTRDFSKPQFRISLGIVIGTIPICVLGLLIKLFFKEAYTSMRGLISIGIASIVMSSLLWFSEKLSKKERTQDQITFIDCVLIGCSQALAIFPGVSRSGATLTMALFRGIKRSDAARFSFLLGIPAITLAGLVELKDVLEVRNPNYIALLVGLLSSTFFSYLSIVWMVKFLQKHSTMCFIIYRLLFGAFLLSWAFFRI